MTHFKMIVNGLKTVNVEMIVNDKKLNVELIVNGLKTVNIKMSMIGKIIVNGKKTQNSK